MGRGKRNGQAVSALGHPAADRTGDGLELAEVYDFALVRHGQQRYGELPYSHHLDAVAAVLKRFDRDDPVLVAAAYLHDVVEDTETTVAEVESRFGADVATLVWAVSSEPGKNRKERNALTYPKIRVLPGAVVLKLADRIANVEQSLAEGGSLLTMYRSEFSAFRDALYVPGVADEMWAHLDELLK